MALHGGQMALVGGQMAWVTAGVDEVPGPSRLMCELHPKRPRFRRGCRKGRRWEERRFSTWITGFRC